MDIREIQRKELPAGYYDDAYKFSYDWQQYIKLADKMVEQMKLTGAKDKKIIDVGSGVGWFTDHLYFNVSRETSGIDFSEVAIMHAKRMYPCCKFICGSVYDYDYSGCEVAVIMETLEHLEKDIELIEKLPQGCKIYASVPYELQRDCAAHVRIFNEEIVRERYSKAIDIISIAQVDQFLLFYGVRK
jgi:2-polyprenyl-3-methyl-5-hydroxy-6-metoxy-1,4-benzoquinol methylase